MKINKITRYLFIALISSSITFALSWYVLDYCRRDELNLGKKLNIINECVDVLKENEYPINKNGDPVRNATQAYISSLSNDNYTCYIPQLSDIDEMTEYVNTSGTAVASGFQIDIAEDGNILLTNVENGKAAEKQGLCKGDEISAIDGVSVKERGYEKIANKMLGKQDTNVLFTVLRDGEEFDIDFVRDHVYINSCNHNLINDLEYIRFNHIDQLSKGQLEQGFKEAEKLKNIIIDLRDCPGGDMKVASYLAAQICGYCKVTCTDFKGNSTVIENSGNAQCVEKNIVILINENTASSAEIMAAALIQSGMVTSVGTNTYGKGIFQETVKLSNGDYLKYTLGTYTVGDWECYHEIGIEPDIEVDMDSKLIGTDDDIQLKEAIALLD